MKKPLGAAGAGVRRLPARHIRAVVVALVVAAVAPISYLLSVIHHQDREIAAIRTRIAASQQDVDVRRQQLAELERQTVPRSSAP
ncbi:MAG: hypothetical protein HYV63_19325 [Candidatus Schekmanbacteria bacterium]|nr:hypothetical protein [Candidatus Schekmanbacteria bacterium]